MSATVLEESIKGIDRMRSELARALLAAKVGALTTTGFRNALDQVGQHITEALKQE
jgi:hypothetical protein